MADNSLKLDRELYRKIKGMDKNEMAGFLEIIYAMGAEDNKGVDLGSVSGRSRVLVKLGLMRLWGLLRKLFDKYMYY